MPSHKGIACTVIIDGAPAEEFGTETEGSTITCSIVPQDDKPFVFDLDFKRSSAPRHDYDAYADGIKLFNRTTCGRTAIQRNAVLNVNGVDEIREMRFSKLETVDQKLDGMETRAQVLKDIGSLKMMVWRAEKYAPEVTPKYSTATEGIKIVHEKSLKGRAVSHKTLLGSATYEPAHRVSSKRIDPSGCPYVTFIFRYASKSHLQSEGLIPRSPSPEPSIKDGDNEPSVEEMSPEALRLEVLRYRAQNKGKTIKRELELSTASPNPATNNDNNEVAFQSERSVKKRKTTEVISLLDDDD